MRNSHTVKTFTLSTAIRPAEALENGRIKLVQGYQQVKFFGYLRTMGDFELRKLRIFNQLNLFLLLNGLLTALLGMALPTPIPNSIWAYAFWPAFINLASLSLNYFGQRMAALLCFFIGYPMALCIIYLTGLDAGLALHFVFVIVLSVFFVSDVMMMTFSIGYSMISFYMLTVLPGRYEHSAETACPPVFLLNQCTALLFVFYGIYLIKKESATYQANILEKQDQLAHQNREIEIQKTLIAEKAGLLEIQKKHLQELDQFKTKLFSIISHDLKTPMYALRNLFQTVQEQRLPAKDIQELIPHALNDLNFTTSLMENLLQWAKSQMNTQAVNPAEFCLNNLIIDVANLLHLQFKSKEQLLEIDVPDELLQVCTDRNMIHLVLRNLLSNASKYTATGGRISIGAVRHGDKIEVFVSDAGVGISTENLEKVRQQIFYTTPGTSSETGTGLGLMLCNEFLVKCGSRLQIESEEGKGSVFSFLLPAA